MWSPPPPPPRADFRFRRIDTVLASTGPGREGGCNGDGDRLGPLVLDLDQLFAQVSTPAAIKSTSHHVMTTTMLLLLPVKNEAATHGVVTLHLSSTLC